MDNNNLINILHIIITKCSRDYYNISFPFNKEIIDNIKKLEKKEFDGGTKLWKLDPYNLYTLITFFKGRKDIFFEFFDKDEKELFLGKYKKSKEKRDKKQNILDDVLSRQEKAKELKHKLLAQDIIDFDYSKYLNEEVIPWNFQIVGALFAKLLGSCLFGMEQGTGKTLVSILTSEMLEDVKKVLVIVPNSLKFNWGKEIEKFTKQKYFILNEKKKINNKYTIEEAKYIIVNYDYFNPKKFDFNEKIKKYGIEEPDVLICDESHKLKNTKANTTKNISKYFKDTKHIFMLSGTPVQNKLEELYVQLNYLSPEEFTSKSKFYMEFCGMIYNSYIHQWVQAKDPKLEEMNKKLDGIMYRVRKKDVIKDLPDMQINKIYLKMTDEQEKTYQDIENGLKQVDWNSNNLLINKENGGNDLPIVIINKLRQYTSSIKLEHVKELVENLNEEGNKVVVADCFKDPLKELVKLFPNNSALYSGEVESFDRQKLVDAFQDEKNTLMNLFATLQTANFGITLTQSNNGIVMTQDWTPSSNGQFYARFHRIGQKNNVNIYILLFENTIDQDVDNMISEKLKVIDKVVDGEDYKDISNKSVISDILNMYKKKFKGN